MKEEDALELPHSLNQIEKKETFFSNIYTHE